MKAGILVLIFTGLISATVQAQYITKGTTSAGGSFNFSFMKTKSKGQTESYLTLELTPIVGGFITPRIWLGGMIGYSLQQTQVRTIDQFGNISESKNIVHSLQLGPMVKPYFKIGERSFLTLHASPFYSYGETNFGSSNRYIIKGINWTVGPGLAFFVTPNLALEPMVEYRGAYLTEYIRDENGPLSTTRNNLLQHGMFLGFGLQAYFHPIKQ